MGEPGPKSGASEVQALCARASTGDHGAMTRLLAMFHSRLLSHCARKIGPDWAARIDPEDLLQDAYVDIVATIGQFSYRGEDSFYHWSARVVDHQFIDRVRHLKRKKRDVTRETGTGGGGARSSKFESLSQRLADGGPTVSRIARRQDAISAMMACIARLPDHYRDLVQRLLLDEEPIAKVAADMGKSEDAVRRMAGRAQEQLAELMGEAGRYLTAVEGELPPVRPD